MRGQTDDSWNPHARLEFFKVAFCLVFSLNISETRKVVNEEISKTDEELNQIEDFTMTALSRQEIILDKMNTSVERIENAATGLKSKLLKLWKKSVTPWYLCQEQNYLNMVKNQIISS